jgi:hypothetical protein
MANIYLGDVLAVATVAWSVYRACKLLRAHSTRVADLCASGSTASSEFKEVTHEVQSLHTALIAAKDELADLDAFLDHTLPRQRSKLQDLLGMEAYAATSPRSETSSNSL